MMDKNSKIYVAGHKGLVGSALINILSLNGYTNIKGVPHEHVDLTNTLEVDSYFNLIHPEYVFLAAAKVGGIHANNTYPAEFIYNNLAIQTNVIHSAYCHRVKKLMFLGSVCIYPKYAEIPVKEESLLTGEVESTN